MMPLNFFQPTILGFMILIGGCTSAWIANPSPTTRNLIDDLKLEGYVCKALRTSIECRQEKPYMKKAPKVCTSSTGCVEQPGEMVTNVYSIEQDAYGIPGIIQWVETKPIEK